VRFLKCGTSKSSKLLVQVLRWQQWSEMISLGVLNLRNTQIYKTEVKSGRCVCVRVCFARSECIKYRMNCEKRSSQISAHYWNMVEWWHLSLSIQQKSCQVGDSSGWVQDAAVTGQIFYSALISGLQSIPASVWPKSSSNRVPLQGPVCHLGGVWQAHKLSQGAMYSERFFGSADFFTSRS